MESCSSGSKMSAVEKSVMHWHCDHPGCGFEWPQRGKKPAQCPSCGKRQWDGGRPPKPARLVKPDPFWKPNLARVLSPAEAALSGLEVDYDFFD